MPTTLPALAAAALLVAGSSAAAAPEPGTLDATFSKDGRAFVELTGRVEPHVRDLLVTRAAVVVVGSARQGSGDARTSGFLVSRLTPSGKPDRTFGRDGVVVTEFDGSASARRVARLPHGRLLVAGTAGGDFALAVYRKDGRLDPGFGDGGTVVTAVSTQDDEITDVRVRDGRILVAGLSGDQFATVAYELDGDLDTGYGRDGLVRTTEGFDGTAYDVALDAPGRLVAVGVEGGGPFAQKGFSVARFTPDGVADPTFGGGDGRVTTTWGGDEEVDRALAVVIQPDGRILAGGDTFEHDDSAFAVARYLNDGSPDLSFGRRGRTRVSFPTSYAEIKDLAIDHAGRIVAAGFASGGSPPRGQAAVARLSPEGKLDPSFAGDGTRLVGLVPGRAAEISALDTAAGRIVVAGRSADRRPLRAAVARLHG